MVMVLAPTKKKADAQAERKAEVAARPPSARPEVQRDRAERAASRTLAG
jgi:hypothetical protein